VDDALVGLPSSALVYGYFGPISGTLSSSNYDLRVTGSSGYFGASVAYVGDHDGDGAVDVAIGQYGNDDGGTDAGAVHVFLNSGF
jgi:hypothetical protein